VKMKTPTGETIITNPDATLDAINQRLAQVEERFKPKTAHVRPFSVGDRVCSVRDTEATYLGIVVGYERDGVVLVKFQDHEFPKAFAIQSVERPVERVDKRLMRTTFPESEESYQISRDQEKQRK
jgi:hypothetical protein